MKFSIITIFPGIFDAYLNEGILKRALQKRIIEVEVHNLRDYTVDKHRASTFYGGGSNGRSQTVLRAVEPSIPCRRETVIMLSPREKFNQQMAVELSKEERPLFFCGRYEAVDERCGHLGR
jgi:tRNA (guanine37-N1)-methyltransferase